MLCSLLMAGIAAVELRQIHTSFSVDNQDLTC